MYNKKPIIDYTMYINDMYKLLQLIKSNNYDCIICLKRSGFILGTFLSNQLTLPLFVPSEINSIPNKFTNILIVDDKICTGKSLNKVVNKLPIHNIIKTAVMYVQGTALPDIYVTNLQHQYKMWYEGN